MLTFLNPGFAVAGLMAAIAMAALHFIVRRRPRSMLFATTRFVPEGSMVATSWAKRPSDALLAALRVAAVLLAGLALAGPALRRQREPVSSVILADRSRAVADSREVDDSVAALFQPGDIFIAFDSATGMASAPSLDGGAASGRPRGSLSAGFVAAIRAASDLRDRADSVALVVVSPLSSEEIDAATLRIRDEWPGRARVVPVAARSRPATDAPVAMSGEASDPLRVALYPTTSSGSVGARVVRGDLTAADSAWAAEEGRVLVHWPVNAAPSGFVRAARGEAAAGLLTRTSSAMAPFERRFRFAPTEPRAVAASWVDGEPAALESAYAGGCIRSVAIPVAFAGDLVLRDDFRAVAADLLAPCGGALGFGRMPAAVIGRIVGSGSLAKAESFPSRATGRNAARPWLLLVALVCLIGETLLRRLRGRVEPGSAPDISSGEPEAKVA